MIDKQTLIDNAQPAHLSALLALAGGESFRTTDPVEKEEWKAMGEVLLDAGMITYYRVRTEIISNIKTYIFDGLVPPAAAALIGQVASDLLIEHRAAQAPPSNL